MGCCCACEFWGWLAGYCISVLFVSLGLCFVLLGNFLLGCFRLCGFVNSVAVLRCSSLGLVFDSLFLFVVGYVYW